MDATEARSARLRGFFARVVAAAGGAEDPRIEQAFAAVPRDVFAGPAPWSIRVFGPWWQREPKRQYIETPDGDPAYLYQDTLIALDAGRGINIGQPSLHALCLAAAAPRAGETVVQVGTGSGYYTAILAELVGPGGHVDGFEIDAGLARRAAGNLAPWPWAEVHAQSGAAGDLPPADLVYVNAGLTQPSPVWLDALRPGGRLIFPLQPEGGFGGMLLVERPPGEEPVWPARFVSRAGFIACQAEQVAETGSKLAATFAAGGWERVRRLHRTGAPDATCWFDGGGWWLGC